MVYEFEIFYHAENNSTGTKLCYFIQEFVFLTFAHSHSVGSVPKLIIKNTGIPTASTILKAIVLA